MSRSWIIRSSTTSTSSERGVNTERRCASKNIAGATWVPRQNCRVEAFQVTHLENALASSAVPEISSSASPSVAASGFSTSRSRPASAAAQRQRGDERWNGNVAASSLRSAFKHSSADANTGMPYCLPASAARAGSGSTAGHQRDHHGGAFKFAVNAEMVAAKGPAGYGSRRMGSPLSAPPPRAPCLQRPSGSGHRAPALA